MKKTEAMPASPTRHSGWSRYLPDYVIQAGGRGMANCMAGRTSQNSFNYQKRCGNLSENRENRNKEFERRTSGDYSQLSEEVSDNEY